jgi:hypothetical protein
MKALALVVSILRAASARGSTPLKPLAQSTKPRWGWICQADRPL